MKTQLVQIGNSHGIRIPKPLIDEIGLHGDLVMEVKEGSLVLRPAAVRQGWATAAAQLAEREPGLLDEETATDFDEEEWQW